jgi:hypothetical protein
LEDRIKVLSLFFISKFAIHANEISPPLHHLRIEFFFEAVKTSFALPSESCRSRFTLNDALYMHDELCCFDLIGEGKGGLLMKGEMKGE